MGWADKFDLQDAIQCMLGAGAPAFAIFTSKTLAPSLWKSFAVLIFFLGVLVYANYKKRRSVEHIVIALIFIAIIVWILGWWLDQILEDIMVGIVGGFIGGIGLDTLLGKGSG
jgi:uncharacterized membrane protein YoaK (UPF0700 family)